MRGERGWAVDQANNHWHHASWITRLNVSVTKCCLVIRTQSTHLLLYNRSLRNAGNCHCLSPRDNLVCVVPSLFFVITIYTYFCAISCFARSDWTPLSGSESGGKKSDTWDRYILPGTRGWPQSGPESVYSLLQITRAVTSPGVRWGIGGITLHNGHSGRHSL